MKLETDVQGIEDEQRERYRDAVDAVAGWLVHALSTRAAREEDLVERAAMELRLFAAAGSSEHAWIFRDPLVLSASDGVFEALDEGPDGRRDWLHADLASAIAAVARHDVMVAVGELMASAEGLDDEAEDGVSLTGEGAA